MQDNPTQTIMQALKEARALQERSHKLLHDAEKALSRMTTTSVVSTRQAATLLGCVPRTLHNIARRHQLTPRNADGSPKTTNKNTKTFYSLAEIWKLLNP